MTKPKLAIIGRGGHARVAGDIAYIRGYSVEYFDEASSSKKDGGHIENPMARAQEFTGVFIGIGDNETRSRLHPLIENIPLKIWR